MVKNRSAPPRAHGATALLPALRARIARHELPPGAKLLENELSREFGVSRAYPRGKPRGIVIGARYALRRHLRFSFVRAELDDM